jgi:glycosyltransferase involved in cell wall biosynthesis
VPPADPEAVAAAIARLVRDCELSARMGRAGRRRVEEEFDVRTMVHRMEGLYRELVGGTGIARAA